MKKSEKLPPGKRCLPQLILSIAEAGLEQSAHTSGKTVLAQRGRAKSDVNQRPLQRLADDLRQQLSAAECRHLAQLLTLLCRPSTHAAALPSIDVTFEYLHYKRTIVRVNSTAQSSSGADIQWTELIETLPSENESSATLSCLGNVA